MKRTASEGKSSRSSGSSIGRRPGTSARSVTKYVLCLKNNGYRASLELGKLYRCLRDRDAEQYWMRRVVDETGEDYLYPRDWFIEVRLPTAAKRALSSIAR